MTFIHGFRPFKLGRCYKTGNPVLEDLDSGQHLHSALQTEAVCHVPGAQHEDAPTPDWYCDCGYDVYRTYDGAYVGPDAIYAHVMCLGRTILHANGSRTERYSVDYFLVSEPGHKVHIIDPTVPDSGGMEVDQVEVVATIAEALGVSVLKRDSNEGCPVCAVVNGWRVESLSVDDKKRDWFGEGFHG